jgi:thiamine pyrophosphate-dependent acetolactate synthase large subunit-like protein
MSTTIAEQFVEVLRQAGVARVYGVVGDSLNRSNLRSLEKESSRRTLKCDARR